jgi:hypothetical protein
MRYRIRMPAFGLLLLLGLVGCGRYYPVSGKVTLDDGTPVTDGLVIFEQAEAGDKDPVMARGEIKSDGSFQLSSVKPGDGLPTGKYRALVTPKGDLEGAAAGKKPVMPYDQRYTDFKTSHLEFEVKEGSNDFPITLKRPGR